MTPQEQQMIDGLISRIRNTPVQNKDTEAEQHIQQSLSGYPDALYVLVQTVLVQQYGLQQAQAQLNELKQQNQLLQDKLEQAAQQAKSSGGGSFLSHIFGSGSSSTQSPQAPQPPSQSPYQPVNNPGYGSQSYPGGYPPPPPPYPAQGYPQGGSFGGGGFGGGGFGGGGFLQGALQTAAGVAAGEMVFQGMEDLFHGFGHGGGSERGFGMPGGSGETVVNNYYDDDRGGDRDRDSGSRDRDDQNFYNPDNDASRSSFGDTAQTSSDFGSGSSDFTDTGTNDLSFDDSGSGSDFDNSGSDDFSSSDDNS